MTCVMSAAKNVLLAASPDEKFAAARNLSAIWRSGEAKLPASGTAISVPDRPSRLDAPELLPPYQVKRRRLGTQKGRAALMHAIAHIEFNAIDLAADMVARYGGHKLIDDAQRHVFITDWVNVCDDEARHFGLVRDRLIELGSFYGELPAHDGLWQASEATSTNITARLVIAPMVLEARGLDVTPTMITKLRAVSDDESADILQIIYDDEIGHVAAGSRWFLHICTREGLDPKSTFHLMVRTYFKGLLKPPFNREARDLAGVPVEFYEPLSKFPS